MSHEAFASEPVAQIRGLASPPASRRLAINRKMFVVCISFGKAQILKTEGIFFIAYDTKNG